MVLLREATQTEQPCSPARGYTDNRRQLHWQRTVVTPVLLSYMSKVQSICEAFNFNRNEFGELRTRNTYRSLKDSKC